LPLFTLWKFTLGEWLLCAAKRNFVTSNCVWQPITVFQATTKLLEMQTEKCLLEKGSRGAIALTMNSRTSLTSAGEQ